MSDSLENPVARLAARYISQTNQHLFLTGRAGTGKTTFLRHIVETTYKNTIVAAPTGIAAINAGGVTLHSLFQLPFGAFIPVSGGFQVDEIHTAVNTPKSFMKSFQMNRQKRKMLREMELLIIDEVSMLRADILDAIDTVLRFVRRSQYVPFGGVQVLFIGDMLQLPPVIKNEERALLSPFYQNGYFFEAKALEQHRPIYFELETIYRQTDPQFIHVLNHIRENSLLAEDVTLLNTFCNPGFTPKKDEGYIYLTTHNRKALDKNNAELAKLPGKTYRYEALVEGDFNEYNYPLEYMLELKEGAQVMFVKNDYSGEQRYFNGKIGVVSSLSAQGIEVDFKDGSSPFSIDKYGWENKRYTVNQETNEVEEEVVGTFVHYPVKLAWAITIHKSQGLTFDRAIIDVERVFASGQMYVALSRLRSLQGLVLSAPIRSGQIAPDQVLVDFSRQKLSPEELESSFEKSGRLFIRQTVLEAFDCTQLMRDLTLHVESYNKDEKRSEKQHHRDWAKTLQQEFLPVGKMGARFVRQVRANSSDDSHDLVPYLNERVQAAIAYFEPLFKGFSQHVFDQIKLVKLQKGVKKYLTELAELETLFYKQLQSMHKAQLIVSAARDNLEVNKDRLHNTALYKHRRKTLEENHTPLKKIGRKLKPEKELTKPIKKVPTQVVSYGMFREGKSIDLIARERGMVVSTIEKHLIPYVRSGDIRVAELVEKEKVDKIRQVIDKHKSRTQALKPVKEELGEGYTYSEIRFVMSELRE